jgi:hypothetical protein
MCLTVNKETKEKTTNKWKWKKRNHHLRRRCKQCHNLVFDLECTETYFTHRKKRLPNKYGC